MADSIIGDLTSTIGSSVDGVAHDALSSNASSLIGEALSHVDLDVSAATAGLTQAASTQVIDAVHDLGHVPTQEELDDLVHKAQDADAHKVDAEAQQHEQAKAAEHGEFAKAHELEQQAEYNLHAAADAGGHVDHAVVEAQKEGAALDNANWQQQIAHEAAHDAATYVESGDVSHAESYAHIADDHASTASDYGHAGDHGGSAASHDSSTDTSSHDALAASE